MRGVQSNISSTLGGAGATAGHKAGSNFANSFKRFITSAGIGTAITKAFMGGAELQQNLGGTSAVFGNYAKIIQDQAQTAYKTMGSSASDYMATANKMGSLFQGSGLTQQRSLELTSQAMQRAADVASVMGIDTAVAMESIAGAAKGNFTMMDNLGVSMNATTLEAYALSKGLDFAWNSASNAEKAELAMQMFFERTAQYAGNFARESSDTISGSLGAMKAAFSNVLGNLTLGNDIAPSLTALGDSITTFVSKNMLPAVVNILSGLPSVIGSLISSMPGALIPSLLENATSLFVSLSESLPTVFTEFLANGVIPLIHMVSDTVLTNLPIIITAGSQMLSALLQGIVDNIPAIAQALPTVINSIVTGLMSNIHLLLDAGISLFNSLIQAIPIIIPPLVDAIPTIIKNITSALSVNFPQIVFTIVNALIDAAPDIFNATITALMSIVKAIPQILDSVFSSMKSIGLDLGRGLIAGLTSGYNWIKEKLSGWVGNVLSYLKGLFGIHSPSTETAWMGEMLDKGLASGILGNTGYIRGALGTMAKTTLREFNAATPTLSNQMIMDSSITHSYSASSEISMLYQTVDALGRRIENMKIYLDGDKLVGGTSARTDNALGQRQLLVSRGVI